MEEIAGIMEEATRKIANLTTQLAAAKAKNKNKPTGQNQKKGKDPQGGKPTGGAKAEWPRNLTCKKCGKYGHPEGQCKIYIDLATKLRAANDKNADAMWKKINLFRHSKKDMQGVPDSV